ncbi:SAM-dependent methyltransferase [Streptomyces sp. SID8379]|uniref:SAM-dependent methyltransferase n=1 Tax=unclassified Streptomyces TaxID=2593676 RepID=UPI00037A4BD1|nr:MULTISPECIES: SAM-dependent methyltransferase [unclassified Streptomyces]MYW69776.1 SAM-dependent methyltransferase [Streptomyces sp. SID8379]
MTALSPRSPNDTNQAHPARVYDWLLGGKDNYPVDEAMGEKLPPEVRVGALQNRAFMNRAVTHLAGLGIDQFLDIGTGIPTAPNLHQIVQRTVPSAKVVYTDYDPIVLRHAEALLVSRPEGATDYFQADVREPVAILEHARTVLDFGRPIGLSLVALMHFVADEEDPYGIVDTLVSALPSGSHLVLSHASNDIFPEVAGEATEQYARGGMTLALRSRKEVARFIEGLEPVEPGLVTAPEWFREQPAPQPEPSGMYAVVARVP